MISEVTQYCPVCEYDLHGLPKDRCPECGTEFNRAVLPVLRRAIGPVKSHPFAVVLLVVAILLAPQVYSWSPGPFNTFFQLAYVFIMWGLGGLWVWLSRLRWRRRHTEHRVLWLLLLCCGTVNRANLSAVWETGLSVLAAILGLGVLLYAFLRAPRQSLRGLLLASAIVLLFSGVATMVVGLVRYVFGMERGTYGLLGQEVPAQGIYHVYAAIYGVLAALAGCGFYWLSRLLRGLDGDHDHLAQLPTKASQDDDQPNAED